MTPTAIAAKLRQHSPGCLPESIDSLGPLSIEIPDKSPLASPGDTFTHFLPDDVAEAVLIAAMVMDCRAVRLSCPAGWDSQEHVTATWSTFFDRDHGGPLGACHAAWLYAKGINP